MTPALTLAWCTDPHLPHATPAATSRYWREVGELEADHLVVTGDLARGDSLETVLLPLHDRAPCPVSFVLGTHDFYGGSISAVRRQAADLARDRELLVLCGHSHGGGTLEARPNLTVWTGAAEYGSPRVQEVFTLGAEEC